MQFNCRGYTVLHFSHRFNPEFKYSSAAQLDTHLFGGVGDPDYLNVFSAVQLATHPVCDAFKYFGSWQSVHTVAEVHATQSAIVTVHSMHLLSAPDVSK